MSNKLKILLLLSAILMLSACGKKESPYTLQDTQNTIASSETVNAPVITAGVEYSAANNFQGHTCKAGEQTMSSSTTVCLSAQEYEDFCKKSLAISLWGVKLMSDDHVARFLIENGDIENFGIYWDIHSCHAYITLSGIYQGSSRRVRLTGKVHSFIVDNEGRLLANEVFPWGL